MLSLILGWPTHREGVENFKHVNFSEAVSVIILHIELWPCFRITDLSSVKRL